jgi:ABC-type Mn2+/Zn2+ transport system permease subunit
LIVVGVLFATLIVALQQKDFLSNDAILGIFSHIALSLGIGNGFGKITHASPNHKTT